MGCGNRGESGERAENLFLGDPVLPRRVVKRSVNSVCFSLCWKSGTSGTEVEISDECIE